jgi:hypothetical protein
VAAADMTHQEGLLFNSEAILEGDKAQLAIVLEVAKISKISAIAKAIITSMETFRTQFVVLTARKSHMEGYRSDGNIALIKLMRLSMRIKGV